MSEVAIRAEGIGKRYRIGKRERYYTLRDTVAGLVATPFRWFSNGSFSTLNSVSQPEVSDPQSEFIWALKDVSFEIKPGEVVGIIGRNGAGKSTLLKILSRITEPTEGEVRIYGRVGSLLEVGTGFHPELTGRENIYLNGAILGMREREINRKFDEIVAFAEIEKFLDTPVKHYSSGMYMRLAFSVAAHLEPEILLVDEVLAVGDGAFQKKCLGKMGDFAKEGRTVVFVSHNLPAIRDLTERALLLHAGKSTASGKTTDVISAYLRNIVATSSTSSNQFWNEIPNAPGNDRIRLRRIRVIPESTEPTEVFLTSTQLNIEVEYWTLLPDTALIVNLSLYHIDGSPVFESSTTTETKWHGRPFPKGRFRSVCHIPGNLLNEGMYRLRILFADEYATKQYDCQEAAIFTIHDTARRDLPWYGRYIGPIHPLLEWQTECLEKET
jgi:lipopolysaccharide transport system ATP-binding protein